MAPGIIRRSANDHRKGYEEFEAAVREDPDEDLDEFDCSKAELVYPSAKWPVSIRIDEDVLAFFKEGGPGYQARINAVLRCHIEHPRRDRG